MISTRYLNKRRCFVGFLIIRIKTFNWSNLENIVKYFLKYDTWTKQCIQEMFDIESALLYKLISSGKPMKSQVYYLSNLTLSL